MRLLKECLVILNVLIFLLNDSQIALAHTLIFYQEQIKAAGCADTGIDPFLGADPGEIHLVYELNGGINSNYNPSRLKKQDLPILLDVPVREGYNFAGWYKDSSYVHKVTEITPENAANMVLFAKWTKSIDNNYNVEMYSYASENTWKRNQKMLRECRYGFLEEMDIPGMPSTREKDYLDNLISSESQCMQGLCFTPELILMTSYSENEKTPGSLMVFHRQTGEYLVTLGMKKQSHLGGVAYDGKNIWICHSNSNTLERISYDYIRKIAMDAPKCFVDASALSDEYHLRNTPSCINCYGGRIWVATHTRLFDSKMISYSYNEEDDLLVPLGTYQIPSKVQGIAFDEEGAVYLSTSYGRNKSSFLKVYTSLLTLDRKPNDPAVKVEMPPCSEELVIADDNVYVLFESASRKYFEGTDGNGTSASPIDKILEVEVASIW